MVKKIKFSEQGSPRWKMFAYPLTSFSSYLEASNSHIVKNLNVPDFDKKSRFPLSLLSADAGLYCIYKRWTAFKG
jgi:hypothetical protein